MNANHLIVVIFFFILKSFSGLEMINFINTNNLQ